MTGKTYQYIGIIIFLGVFCLLLNGCRDSRQKEPEVADSTARKELYIGLVPELNIFEQRKRYEPLAEYLTFKTGIKIMLRTLVTYENIIENLQSQNLDAVFLGSFAGALALKKIGVRPIARPEYPNGTSTYNGLIFTRKDSGIASAQDMKGKTFAFADKGTTAGWLLPLHYFQENNITDPASWFGKLYFSGTHEDAILDVLNGKADIGAAKNTVYKSMAQTDQRLDRELEILVTSPPVPENALLVFPDVEESLQEKLRVILLGMHLDDEGKKALQALGAAKFIETSPQDYQPVFEYAEHIGLDLKTYKNEDDFVDMTN